jgi:hypothetical protein
MGMGSNTSAMAGTRPGAKSGQGACLLGFLRFLLSDGPTTPLIHYSISSRFPATFPAAFLCMG